MGDAAPVSSCLDPLQELMGYRFVHPALLEQALHHRSSLPDSAAGTNGSDWHNERLEFLGDAVLTLQVSRILFQTHQHAPEGTLSQWRATLVNTLTLSNLARDLGLGELLFLGRGEALSGGREKRSILAGTLEAILGAAYLDGGEDAAAEVVQRLFHPLLAAIEPEQSGKDYKSLLQELLQATGRLLPVYRVTAVNGAPHQREFSVECIAQEAPPGHGTGPSKRAAEQEAARMVMAYFNSREPSL